MSGGVTEVEVALDPFGFSRPSTFSIANSLKGVPDKERNLISVSKNSLYGDMVWDLSGEHPDLHPQNVEFDFSLLNFDDGTNLASPGNYNYLRSLKEYAFSMRNDPPSSHPKWSSFCNSGHRGVRNLVRYMHAKDIRYFSELTPTDLSQFLEELALTPLITGGKITNHTLRSRVYGLHWLYEQALKLEDGLAHDPFEEYGSMTQWANKCCEKSIPRRRNRTIEMPDLVAKELLKHALDDLSLADTLEAIRVEQGVYAPKRVQVRKKVRIVNPFPWHKYGLKSGLQVRGLEVRLTAACYIVIAMLTGMRWHEITAIKSGGVNNWTEEEIEHNGLKRTFCFVVSRTNKLQARPTEYLWQTLPVVKDALEAAERGLAQRRKTGFFLFPSRYIGQRASDSSTNNILKKFANLHSVRFEGKVWSPASHQFRKKFARIMVRQGLGLRALQDQLKHFDIEMTRGYGDMNLYVELQQEKFQLSTEQYDELLSNQVPIVGGGAAEVQELRKQFLGMTRKDRLKFLEELPRSAVIEQVDDGLCMYRPEKALCGGDRAACRPADCNNSVMLAEGKKKTFEWRRMENVKMSDYFKAEPLKVAFLKERIGELDKLLKQLEEYERSVSV